MEFISSDTNVWVDFRVISRIEPPFRLPLTGDMALRKAAAKEGVKIMGTLGILDQLYQGNYISASEYRECLQGLQVHNGGEVRLPRAELKRRLEEFYEGK